MKSLLKFKFKLRHGIFSLYSIIASVILLKLFNIIQINWLVLASPFLFGVFSLILYLAILLLWVYIENRKQAEIISEEELNTETSFFCHGCAKPFDKPIKHGKGEFIYHKHCKPKKL